MYSWSSLVSVFLGQTQKVFHQTCHKPLNIQSKIDDPCYLWNVDEHGTEDVLKCSKVVGIKGIKANQTVCREKSHRSTMMTYVNAAGHALPPMVIHRTGILSVPSKMPSMLSFASTTTKWGKVFKEGRLLNSLQCGLGKSND